MGRLSIYLSMALGLMMLVSSSFAGERRELKKMCKAQYKECREVNTKSFCKKKLKQCRVENEVSFKDDVKLFKKKVAVVAKQIVGLVSVDFGVDETFGEYIEINVESKVAHSVNDFVYSPEGIDSFMQVTDVGVEDSKTISIVVYTKDLEDNEYAESLQTTPGRFFPKFFDGARFEELFGVKFEIAGISNFQFYLDPEKEVFGAFVPAAFAGNWINALNDFKNNNLGKVGEIIPNINSIPVAIKVEKKKIGKAYLLSKDEDGKNSGIVLLFDINRIR